MTGLNIVSIDYAKRLTFCPVPQDRALTGGECIVGVHADRFAGETTTWFDQTNLDQFREALKQLSATHEGSCTLTSCDLSGMVVCSITIKAVEGSDHFSLQVVLADRTSELSAGEVRTGFAIDPSILPELVRALQNLSKTLFGPAPPNPPTYAYRSFDPEWPGARWRIVARDWHTRRYIYDIEGQENTWFDELWVGDWLHIEWMQGRHYWMRIGDASINVALPKGQPPVISIERDNYYDRPSAAEEVASLASMDPNDEPGQDPPEDWD